jgi:hypothetical protein
MLTQVEADGLIAMEKRFVQQVPISLLPGVDETYDLIGEDPHERFQLDLGRGRIRRSKLKFQTRGRKVVVLVRLDVDGSPHTNPDGTRLGETHLHLYRERYEDRWADPLNPAEFTNVSNMGQAFHDFCCYCRITHMPPFEDSLL